MSSEEVLVQIEPVEVLEENYSLLPYVLNDENFMVLNEEIYEERETDETVLCVPICDTLFDCNIGNEVNVDNIESGNFLSEHNYHSVNSNEYQDNAMDMYFANILETKDNYSPKLQCPLCQKVMRTPCAFYRHLRIHSGEKPYQCELCDKKFSQQSNLWKHVLIHTGERKFECPNCQKKFSQRANMQKHMMVHTGEKPFECYICLRTFTQRANLNKHIRIHTGEKPYTCKYCNRQFAQQSNMQKHELLHEGLKPFVCSICAAAFTQQSNLKKHIETHSNCQKPQKSYLCILCRKTYNTKSNLLRHMEKCPEIFSEASEPNTIQVEDVDIACDELYYNVKVEIEMQESE